MNSDIIPAFLDHKLRMQLVVFMCYHVECAAMLIVVLRCYCYLLNHRDDDPSRYNDLQFPDNRS
ncbi:hypothetical protein BDW66DRAFT_142544 [Aspergillus desertorum]